jgi:hypothetical protein
MVSVLAMAWHCAAICFTAAAACSAMCGYLGYATVPSIAWMDKFALCG